MQSEEQPLSFKERLARYQNLVEGSNTKPSGASKPPAPSQKTSLPTTFPPPPVSSSPPASLSPSNGGQVESPSIVRPSANKNFSPSNTLNYQGAKSNSPSMVPPPTTVTQTPPSGLQNSGSTNEGVDSASVLPVNALKQMLQARNFNASKAPSSSSPTRVSLPQQQGIGEARQPGIVESRASYGNVKQNAKKLEQYYEAQRMSQQLKAEEDLKRKQQQIEKTPQVEEKPAANQQQEAQSTPIQSNTQNITGANTFYVPPELSQPDKPVKQESLEQAEGVRQSQGEGNLMARLQKKKRVKKESFESDSD